MGKLVFAAIVLLVGLSLYGALKRRGHLQERVGLRVRNKDTRNPEYESNLYKMYEKARYPKGKR